MIAGPALSGALQLTVTLLTDTVVTAGASGLPGFSPSTSVTVTVIVCVTLFSRSPVPLVTSTTTMYSLLPASFAGSVLASSCASSKFGAALKLSTPVLSPISNCSSSAPPETS